MTKLDVGLANVLQGSNTRRLIHSAGREVDCDEQNGKNKFVWLPVAVFLSCHMG